MNILGNSGFSIYANPHGPATLGKEIALESKNWLPELALPMRPEDQSPKQMHSEDFARMRRVLTPLSQDQSLNQMRSKHFTPMLGAPIRPDNGSHTALRNEHRLLAPTAPVRLNSLLA